MGIYTLTPPGHATLHNLKVFNIIYGFLERHKTVVGSSGLNTFLAWLILIDMVIVSYL